jgi:hypothetical protein
MSESLLPKKMLIKDKKETYLASFTYVRVPLYLNSAKGTVSQDKYLKSRRGHDLILLATMKTLLKFVPKATTEFLSRF